MRKKNVFICAKKILLIIPYIFFMSLSDIFLSSPQDQPLAEILWYDIFGRLSSGNVYQYFGFQEVDGHIEFMNTLNLMNPENDYLIFMDSSPLNAYQNEPAFILKSEFFGYIKTDHTDTLTLEGNYRDYNFSDLANYEFFSTSESVTKTLNYIRSELLKKFT